MLLKKFMKAIGFPILLLLFLYLLNPYSLNFYFGYVLVVLVFFKKYLLRHNLDSSFVLLLFISIVYALFYSFQPNRSVQFIFVYALFPSGFYLLGKYITERLSKSENALFFFLLLVGMVYSLTPLISVFMNIIEGGFGQLDRSLPLFWNGKLVTATIMGSYLTLNMCIPALLLVNRNKSNLWFNIVTILIFLISLSCVLRIGSRTQILIFLFAVFCSLIYIVPRQSLRRNFFTFILFGVGISILAANVSFDLNQDWLSTFAGRMDNGGADDIASGGGRTERWAKSFDNLFIKPLGWSISEFGHSHNLWLDVLRVSGVIPFFLLILFSIKSFINVKSAVASNNNGHFFNNQIIVYFTSFFLVFMVEPIFEGVFEMFVLFCMFMGIINKYRTMQPVNP